MSIVPASDTEQRIHAYGKEIFARLDRRAPMVFSPAWVDDLLMQASMSDEAVKIQLFRFIDALPNLRDSSDVSGHLREYMSEAAPHLPWWGKLGVKMIPRNGLGGKVVAWAADTNAKRMARRFIAGSNVPEAIVAIQKLRERSLA